MDVMLVDEEPSCFNCGRRASEIPEYLAEMPEFSPAEMAFGDGTYNRETNHFCCTECYIKIGMPTTPEGWKAP